MGGLGEVPLLPLDEPRTYRDVRYPQVDGRHSGGDRVWSGGWMWRGTPASHEGWGVYSIRQPTVPWLAVPGSGCMRDATQLE